MNEIQTTFLWIVSFIGIVFSLRLLLFVFLEYFRKKIVSSSKTASPVLFFSSIVPAREESTVILQTIRHILKIQYPPLLQEIILITDQKETLQKKELSTYHVVNKWLEVEMGAIRKKKTAECSEYCLKNAPSIFLFDIPSGFDGTVRGEILSHPVPSTKARALNYAITHMKDRGLYHYCSFFDAETHPDPHIFSTLNQLFLKDHQMDVWQGPALQVRNFWEISFFCKIAALSQAFSHEFTLPSLLKWIPFLGGTNMHIPFSLIQKLKGFQHDCVTEDMELGLRFWQLMKKLPRFLPISCTEQTPATLQGYYNQRRRWGKGTIQVILKACLVQISQKKELRFMVWKLFFFGPFEWFIYGILSIIVLQQTVQTWFRNSPSISYGVVILTGLLFMGTLYIHYAPYIQNKINPPIRFLKLIFLGLFCLFLLPLCGFFYGLPFMVGTVDSLIFHFFPQKTLHNSWIKTPRTPE